jgi:RNA polymerase sigma-70 factor (ECF subfamily)
VRDGAQRAAKAARGEAAPDEEETRIFACLAKGDRAGAQTELFRAYGAGILARCMQLMRDQARAEDVAQQVVLEACRDLHRFERRSSLRTWLSRIAKNRCLDELKKQRSAAKYIENEGDVVVDAADGGAGPEVRLDDAKLRAALEECLQELPAATAETVRLRFQDEDLSYDDMAVVMNAQASTLNQRVIRALKSLEQCLARKGWAHGRR